MKQTVKKNINRTLAFNNAVNSLHYECDYEVSRESKLTTVALIVSGVELSSATADNKKKAKEKARESAVDSLFSDSIEVISINGRFLLKEIGTQEELICTETKNKNNLPSGSILDYTESNVPSKQSTNEESTCDDNLFCSMLSVNPNISERLVILDAPSITTTVSILCRSTQFCKIPLEFDYPTSDNSNYIHCCEMTLGNEKVCQVYGQVKTDAKEYACRVVLNELRSLVYTIKIKEEENEGFVVPRNQMLNSPTSSSTLSDNNIGCKMLKMMGWAGGGIGKEGKLGISEPINAEDQNWGQGLGYNCKKVNTKGFKSRIHSYLLDYATSETTKDLVFSKEFSSDERKMIHQLAHKFNLKTHSKGKDSERHLIVSKKFEWNELLMILKEVGGSTAKYELIHPHHTVV